MAGSVSDSKTVPTMARDPAELGAPATNPSQATPSLSAKRRLDFLDLPFETQNQIISLCSQPDLVFLSVVSRHFRDLAARQLYRNFRIVFPDEDDPAFESPIDSLASGLDTFVTSDYNYSSHLREISLDTLTAGPKSEKAYRPYLLKNSCGKFMNTLLLLTLRKARCLETFRWNIRVELSRPVYQALHGIGSLKKVHIRMQSGPSLYEPLPPLPYTTPPLAPTPLPPWGDPMDDVASLAPPHPSFIPTPGNIHPQPAFKPPVRFRMSKRRTPAKDPPTLSGFKNLRSLSVLDIDNLQVVGEVRACVKNSAATLRKLRISFSDALAAQARRPPQQEPESDESDVEDEFQVVPVPPPSMPYDNGPARQFTAQEERKKQETVLGKIFDIGLTSSTVKQPSPPHPLPPTLNPVQEGHDAVAPAAPGEATAELEPEHEYLRAIRSVSRALAEFCGDSSGLTNQQLLEMLSTMVAASKTYLDARTPKRGDGTATSTPALGVGGGGENGDGGGGGGADGDAEDQSVTLTPTPALSQGPSSREANDLGISTGNLDNDLGDDLESVADNETEDEQESGQEDGQDDQASSAEADVEHGGAAQRIQSQEGLPQEHQTEDVAEQSAEEIEKSVITDDEVGNETGVCETVDSVDDTEPARVDACQTVERSIFSDTTEHARSPKGKERAPIEPSDQPHQDRPRDGKGDDDKTEPEALNAMNDYVLQSRGMALRELAIHLVPIRASVLSRSLDLHALENVTLLNVGNQVPFWAHMTRENRPKPLRLRRIFTDHVTPTFLQCVSQLDRVDELLLLERSEKYRPESFAPKIPTRIDQIRRLALKKHMHTLKRLMIKDNNNPSTWDIDIKTLLLICSRGARLEELAVSLGVRTTHAFIQHMAGLVNLRALHIIHFRNGDTCVWVMRETVRFIVDCVAHNPQLKLEWIAIENERVDRIMRPNEFDSDGDEEAAKKKQHKKDKKKKALAAITAVTALAAAATATETSSNPPILPEGGWDYSDSGSDDDDDYDDDYDSDSKLKLKTMTGVQFFDVWDVKLFTKEVRAGRI